MINNNESRLIKLLNTNQINQDEYNLLTKSLQDKPKLIVQVFNFLINPYEKISPVACLLISILILFVLSYLCYITNFLGQGGKFHNGEKISYLFALRCILTLWGCISAIFLLISIVLGAIKLRILDFVAFCGLAIFPLFMVILLDSISYFINPKFINPGSNETSLFIIFYSCVLDTVAIMLMFWYIILNFSAFKVSSGLNYYRTWLGFVTAMIMINVLLTVWMAPIK